LKKKVKSSAAEKRKEVLKGLKKIGRSLYGQMEKGK